MSEDWPKGWYQNEKAPGPGPASDATQDMSFASPPPGAGAPPGGGGLGSAWPGMAGPAPGAGSGWPEQPPARSGYSDGPGWGRRGSRWRRWGWPKRILVILASLIVLVVIAGVITYFDLNSSLKRVNVLVSYSGRPAPTAGTNWLITGSDSRGGLTRTQEAQLTLGHDIAGSRSDTIMVLHLPANGTRPVLVSIPRDSYVNIPGYGMNKINAAFAFGGPRLLARTVQDATGLYISHYMSIGLGGLVGVINDIGGVRLCLPAPMTDRKAGLHLKKGCQNLSGAQALAFSRSRNFPNGDLQRVVDQRLLLAATLKKMTSAGTMINPFASIPAASGAASALTVDSGTQLYQLLSVGFALKNPVSISVPFGGFASTNAGSVIVWNKPLATELFHDLATDKALPKSVVGKSGAIEGTA